MDCFQDFCLACDKASPEGPYCSQACRLADLERGSGSTTPTSPSLTRYAWTSSKRPESSYFTQQQQSQYSSSSSSSQQDQRSLTPSSSRSSLSSTSSTSAHACSSQCLSQHATFQLQSYYSSFDQTRSAKRRSSTR